MRGIERRLAALEVRVPKASRMESRVKLLDRDQRKVLVRYVVLKQDGLGLEEIFELLSEEERAIIAEASKIMLGEDEEGPDQ